MAKAKKKTEKAIEQELPEIKISLDSGANIHSCNEQSVTACDLGFDSHADWLDASENEKFQAVKGYFEGNGYPEIYWE